MNLAEEFAGKTILAPLTKGGNLPFRRLCVDFGAEITMSEMAYARQIVKRSRSELALLRKHASETFYGVQIASGKVEDAVKAGAAAVEQGAAFVDINAGCPIHDTVRRGMGATLMRRPGALARMVEAMRAELPVPVTVKLRTGWSESKVTCIEIAQQLEEAGVSAVALHGRSREQRYSKSADWGLIQQLVESVSVPVVGNGDVLTWYEGEARREASGCTAVMVGRGALIKPWLFQEIRDRSTWMPTARERVDVYYRFVTYLKEHFYDDERGRKRAMRFLPWHFGFFCRYRPLPEDAWAERSKEHPLMQTRMPAIESDDPLDLLLQDSREDVHERMAAAMWDAQDLADATVQFERLATEVPPHQGDYDDVAVSHG